MPVSFDASSLLKVTVSMSYIRYIVLKTPTKTGTQGTSNPANRFNPSSQAQVTLIHCVMCLEIIPTWCKRSTQIYTIWTCLINNNTEKFYRTSCLYQRLPHRYMNLNYLQQTNDRVQTFPCKRRESSCDCIESEDTKQITTAIKNVIKNYYSHKGVKVSPTFDIEYLFLNIRGKSVGEEIEVNVTCPDDGVTQVPITINLDDIQVQTKNIQTGLRLMIIL